ncbi:hypothetical protein L6164_035064 [Bauhinia variegata]|nr:hypothetical protein L6164_035064 [Bauhinia variegata]
MHNQNFSINQFKNLQIDNGNGKGGKNNKSHKGAGKEQHQQQHQKGGGGGGQQPQFQNKGVKDLKVPAKNQKSVKFNSPVEEFYESDDGFDEYDEFDDDFDDYDDEEEDEEEGFGHGHGHGHVQMHHMPNKMMPFMGNGRGPHGPVGMINGPAMGRGGGVNAKKADVIDLPVHMNMKGKGAINDVKAGKEGKKSNDGKDGGKKNKGGGGKQNGGGGNKKKAKSGGGLLGRFLGFGKKSNKGGGANKKNKKNGNGGGSGNNKGKEGKKSGGKFDGHDMKMNNKMNDDDFDFHDFDTPHHGKGGKGSNGKGNVGHKGPVGNNFPMEHMRNLPAVQGLPAPNGGYYQGMQMQPPQFNPQQQYLAMMNMMHQQQQQQQQQQQANMNMYPPNPPMMYGRPQLHPSMNYMPPPPMPSHPMADPITHVFSDENTESCTIM